MIRYLDGKLKSKPFARSLFAQSDSSYFEKLKTTLLGSCTEMLDLTDWLNFFCWIALFDAKIPLLRLRNNELTWAKSIKLISWRNEEYQTSYDDSLPVITLIDIAYMLIVIYCSLGTKFQLKLTILIFFTKFAKKRWFRSKTEKVNTTTEYCIFELV